MKKITSTILTTFFTFFLIACSSNNEQEQNTTKTETTATIGQSGVQDEMSAKNVVQVAVSSKDHTTLVAAVKAADLVDALSNAGPFTVFAPTNVAFDLLPAGTVEGLLKPANKDDLVDILQYHVYVGVLKADMLEDGQSFEQVNGGKISITKKDGKTFVNGNAEIVASIPASNGIIHVINSVLLPSTK